MGVHDAQNLIFQLFDPTRWFFSNHHADDVADSGSFLSLSFRNQHKLLGRLVTILNCGGMTTGQPLF